MKRCVHCSRLIILRNAYVSGSLDNNTYHSEERWVHFNNGFIECMDKDMRTYSGQPNEEVFAVWDTKECPWYREGRVGVLKVVSSVQLSMSNDNYTYGWFDRREARARKTFKRWNEEVGFEKYKYEDVIERLK